MGRQVIVVMSDGGDGSSAGSGQERLELIW